MIYELRQQFPVSKLLQIAMLPRSSYYYYIKQLQKGDKYQSIKEKIQEIYEANEGRYGYRRMTLALHNQNIAINHKTVQRLMKGLKLFCRVRMKKYSSYRGEVGETAPNLLNREFRADKPNQKWVTDITEFQLFGKKLYLSPIIDLYNGEVISYDISYHPDFAQVTRMLKSAFLKIPDNSDLILHSDQGWQYRMKDYHDMLIQKGIRQSMSRKATCLDNAMAENFFSLLKTELLYLQEFDSIEHFQIELIKYLDYYNYRRIKLKFGLSPVEYRLQNVAA